MSLLTFPEGGRLYLGQKFGTFDLQWTLAAAHGHLCRLLDFVCTHTVILTSPVTMASTQRLALLLLGLLAAAWAANAAPQSEGERWHGKEEEWGPGLHRGRAALPFEGTSA